MSGEARLIRACADLLNLPQRVTATALVFYHRFQHAVDDAHRLGSQRVVAACLFLASKVEEASLRTNDLLNAVVYLHHAGTAARVAAAFGSATLAAASQEPNLQQQQQKQQKQQQQQQQGDASDEGSAAKAEGQAAGPGPGVSGGGSDPPMLVGAAYYERKHQLVVDEQVLLRVMRFEIGVEHPHRWVFCYCRTLGASAELARAATCLANDSLVHTQLCLRHGPEVVAAAAVHAAELLLEQPQHRPEGAAWWEALGLAPEGVAAASNTLIQLLLQHAATLSPLPAEQEAGRPP